MERWRYKQKYYSVIEKKNLSFAITWMDLEGIILSEISQRKINIVHFHLYVESKKQMNRYDKTEANLQIEKRISGCQRREGRRRKREKKQEHKQMKGIKKYQPLVIKCHRDAMHSTKNYSQYFITTLYSL